MNMNQGASSCLALLLTVAVAASCDRTPTRPTVDTTPPAAPPPAQPPPVRVELLAPRTIALGATAQLQAIGHWSDGTTRDITATTGFSSSDPGVLAISETGLATAVKSGESYLRTVTYPTSPVQEVVVVPEGTFRVRGRLFDAPDGLPITEATVETDGVVPVVTDLYGWFTIYGARGNSRLRITKAGYRTSEVTLAITDHHFTSLTMTLTAPRLDVSGSYELTIEAPAECRNEIPASLVTRRYATTITYTGLRFDGRLSGADFISGSNVFRGWSDPTGVSVVFDDTSYYYGQPDVLEKIDDSRALQIVGSAVLAADGRNFSGLFTGSFVIVPRDGFAARCRGSSRLALTR